MKTNEVINSRNLDKSNLPVRLQNKIKTLERLSGEVDRMESTSNDPDELETLAVARVRLGSLDEELAEDLTNFDPELYRIQKEKMAKINRKKYGKGKVAEPDQAGSEEKEDSDGEPTKEEASPEVQVQSVYQDDGEREDEEEYDDDDVQDEDPAPPISKTLHIKEDLDRLTRSVRIDADSFQPDRQQDPLRDVRSEEVEPEIEEFSKDEGARPKKMSKGLILMGVGAFLLTWGAVNFFKERRG